MAKNRVVVPPMASATAAKDGFVTDQTTEHYRNLARSNAGIVMVEYTFIAQNGKAEPRQLGISRDEHIKGLQKITEAIHEAGSLAILQLAHAGGKSSSEITSTELLSPSGIRVPAKDRELPKSKAMTSLQIQEMEMDFLAAAGRALRAGFDGVEIHAAHGYGINQFLSPLTNQRTDDYGKSRAQILERILSRIRSAHPKLLLSVRMPGQDALPGGLTLQNGVAILQQLPSTMLDLVNVSSGLGGWQRPRNQSGEGYLVEDARFLKARSTVAVIGVGGIETGLAIDGWIQAQELDFAAVGRAILQDPVAWGEAHLFG